MKIEKAQKDGSITAEQARQQFQSIVHQLYHKAATKLFYFLYSNPYNLVLYKEADGGGILSEVFRQILEGKLLEEAGREGRDEAHSQEIVKLRDAVYKMFEFSKFLGRAIQFVDDLPNSVLLEIASVANGIFKLLNPQLVSGEAGIVSKRSMNDELLIIRNLITRPDLGYDKAFLVASEMPEIKEYMAKVRALVARLPPKAVDMILLAIVLKINHIPSDLSRLAIPRQFYSGNIESLFQGLPEGFQQAQPKEGEGRVRRQVPFAKSPIDAYRGRRRGGKLPKSGVLSEDRATRQKELRAMTREELNSMRDVSIADKQLFYAIHTEIPIGDVPFHKKARDAIQKMRDTIVRETAIPQIPYGEASPALGQRGMVLKPPNTQYRYYRWAYPWLKPEYVAEQRAKGVSDLLMRYNTREKIYITDWLDTPTPPSYFGKPGMIGNHTVIGVEDWGVEKRPNPTPKREAAGRVRGGKSFARMMAELK
jgi:hypothetical protein